jgi:hypothetical protein
VVLHLLKCSLDTMDDTRYSGVLWVLQNRRYGTVDLLCTRTVTLQSVVKIFITLYQILRLINVFIKLYFNQIHFCPQTSHTSYSFKLHFNIIFLLKYIYNNCYAFYQLHMWETLFFFSARTHNSMDIFDQHESAVTVSKILHKYNYMLYNILFK